jgi:hypothetical protein
VPNFAGVVCGYIEKNEKTKDLVESCYESRKENELAVLIEYIDRAKIVPPVATFLDIILYSREQITKENLAMGSKVLSSLVCFLSFPYYCPLFIFSLFLLLIYLFIIYLFFINFFSSNFSRQRVVMPLGG